VSPDKQRVIDPRTAPGLAAPRANGNDGRESRDDVARSETRHGPHDGDGVGEKAQRGFARHIDCDASNGAQKKAVRRGGRVTPARLPAHDLDGRVH
jgi:hypothetical protein